MKPALLFYCQHTVGLGHLMRSFGLVRALQERFAVTLLSGGEMPAGINVPTGIELVSLPAIMANKEGLLDDPAEHGGMRQRQQARTAMILGQFARLRPAVILIELFPFGRKKFANELLPLLKLARRQREQTLVVCSLRDILVSGRRGQAHHDERASWLCNRYFDRVLLHADARLARLEDSFAPQRHALRVPVSYTGYVAPGAAPVSAQTREPHLLVSAGGGLVGMPLFSRVLAAHALLDPAARRPLRLIAGPFLPEADFSELTTRVAGLHDVELRRVVPDLAAEMRRASGSVSQCGYNTAMDILASGVPALVAPYVTGTETEQTQRAGRLAELGLLSTIDLRCTHARDMATCLQSLAAFRPQQSGLDLNGAANSTMLLSIWSGQEKKRGQDVVAA